MLSNGDRKIAPRKIAPRKIGPPNISPCVRVRVWIRVRLGDTLPRSNLPGGNFPSTLSKDAKDEILFSTRFSAIFSTIFENIKRMVYQFLSEQLLTTKIFLHKTHYTPPSFQIKVRVLHCRCFQKHPHFTTFLLVFIKDEVCYISYKYQPPNNLVKHQYF